MIIGGGGSGGGLGCTLLLGMNPLESLLLSAFLPSFTSPGLLYLIKSV